MLKSFASRWILAVMTSIRQLHWNIPQSFLFASQLLTDLCAHQVSISKPIPTAILQAMTASTPAPVTLVSTSCRRLSHIDYVYHVRWPKIIVFWTLRMVHNLNKFYYKKNSSTVCWFIYFSFELFLGKAATVCHWLFMSWHLSWSIPSKCYKTVLFFEAMGCYLKFKSF